MCSRSVIALMLVLAGAAAASGQPLVLDFSPPPIERVLERAAGRAATVEIPRCARVPEIDGDLSDEAWASAASFEAPLSGRAQPATLVRAMWDDEALYLAVRCELHFGQPPIAQARERDTGAWKDDCVELWLDPSGQGEDVHQFVVNAAGAIYDSAREDVAWDPKWQRAAAGDAEAWTLEMAIPPAALGLESWPARLGFNLGRNGPDIEPRALAGGYGDTAAAQLRFAGIEETEEQAGVEEAREPLTLSFERDHARPGDRWIEGGLALAPPGRRLAEVQVAATLRAPDGRTLAEASATPARRAGRMLADLRSLGAGRATLQVELRAGEQVLAQTQAELRAQECEQPLREGQRIEIELDLPGGIDSVQAWPVTFGVPFAPGQLWDVNRLRLVDGAGRPIPHQREVAGRWAPEGAVKWVRFDALVSAADGCAVQVGPAQDADGPNLSVQPNEDGTLTVINGPWRYVLGRGKSPVMRISRAGVEAGAFAASAPGDDTRGLYVIDQQGRTASASAEGETMAVEASGPVAACVRFEGPYATADGEELARHITRVEARAGQPQLTITHTLVLTRDSNEVWFRDIGWELAVAPGADAQAVFGTSREDWQAATSVALPGGGSAYMVQDSHYFFAHGENHFQVATVANGAETLLAEGEECGDWAAVHGAAGGLGVACRESALQHPKEFELSGERVTMHLFSGRAGEELDFRSETLAEKWDLLTWYDTVIPQAYRLSHDEVLAKMAANTSNAVGWAKTHDLMLAPLTAGEEPAPTVARLSRLHSQPVLALADPAWICATGAMKLIHPRDPERFPVAESAIAAAVRQWHERIALWGDYGFMDYYAGPHLGYRGNYVAQKRYTGITYTLRPDLWLMYARSGERDIRRFIADSLRTDIDGASAHWDGPTKTRGLFISDSGSDLPVGGLRKGQLPYYWESATTPHISSSTTMNNYAWYYYLTGDRHAADYILEYNEGIKRVWTPARANRDARQLVLMRMLIGGYAFTWDPELRAMAEATMDCIHRPDAPLGFIQERGNFDQPYSTTYKTQVDVRALLEAWEVLGTERYHDTSLRLSRWLWQSYLGDWPLVYTNPLGITGAFLWDETGDGRYAQGLAIAVRQAASAWDPATDTTAAVDSAEKMTFMLEGIAHAQRVLVESGADREPVASWAGFEDFGNPSSIVFRKPVGEVLAFDIQTPEGFRIIPAGADPATHEGLPWVLVETYEAKSIAVPADAPAGDYEIIPDTYGQQMVVASGHVPLVIHAPDWWRPAPPQAPNVRYYFTIPEGAQAPEITFEGSARLLAPDGEPWPDGEPQHGRVALPEDRPGLWAFLPADNQLVRVRNLPPFFAVEDPSSYFEPEIPWAAAEGAEVAEIVPEDGFVPGVSGEEDDRALYVSESGRITMAGGDPHPSGDGLQFLPCSQGTIEFWFRPDWGTVDLPLKGKTILRMEPADGEAWALYYNMAERNRDASLDYYLSHVLYGYFMAQAPDIQHSMRAYRRTVFSAGEWVHIAWVWGPRDGIRARDPGYNTRPQENVLIAQLYVNGRMGQHFNYAWKDNVPASPPTRLMMYNLAAAVDELRISDVQRYVEDFTPPAPDVRFEPDEHTRALLHFDGDTTVLSAGAAGQPEMELRP